MNLTFTAKVGVKAQIVIPKEIREVGHIEEGDYVTVLVSKVEELKAR